VRTLSNHFPLDGVIERHELFFRHGDRLLLMYERIITTVYGSKHMRTTSTSKRQRDIDDALRPTLHPMTCALTFSLVSQKCFQDSNHRNPSSIINHASQPSILQYARSQWWHDGDWLYRECTIQEPQPSCEKCRHSWGRKFSARMLIFSRWTLCLDKHCCRQSTFAVQHTNSIWKDRMENCSINKWVW
jgi:hypothetical protein